MFGFLRTLRTQHIMHWMLMLLSVPFSLADHVLYLNYLVIDFCYELLTCCNYLGLGKISAGNLSLYLPFLLKEIEASPKRQYLLLHSLKEVGKAQDNR